MEPLIVVPANDVTAAGLELEVELPVAWLGAKLKDAQVHARSPGRVAGRLSRSGRADVVVRCRVTASLELPCARCLEPAGSEVDADLSLLLKPRAAGKGKSSRGEYEFSPNEADLDEYDGERVVLDEFVREAILLELPSFPLCSESCGREAGAPASPGSLRGEESALRANEDLPARSPFEALRHLMEDRGLPSRETGGNARSPSPADLRRIKRAKNRAKPKIRSSALHRGKK